MGFQFEDLPRWEFTVEEFSPGGYRIRAVRDGGITAEGTGVDSDAILEDFKGWARRVEDEVSKSKYEPGDRVALVGWPFVGKFRRTAKLVRPKRWFGQRAWIVDLDGGRVSSSRPGTVRTTVAERVMKHLAQSPPD
jgi:hypothetical protein